MIGADPRTSLWPAMIPLSRAGDDEICIVAAQGHRLSFADGSEALCATSGLWNVNLGYGNPAIAEGISGTLHSLSYGGTFRYENEIARQAAAALLDVTGSRYSRVIFSVSGGTANDAVMKLARQYHALRGQSQRKLVVGLRGSYHGLTFGAHGLAGEDLGQQVYGVDLRLVRHISPNDEAQLEALFRALGAQIAAVVVEPVLGSGAVPLSASYIARLGELVGEHGVLLVADEVATGFGRTGDFFASMNWSRPPDVLIASKGLTNGTLPASALLVGEPIVREFHGHDAVFTHAETQAGTAVTAAAVLATVDEISRIDAVVRGRGVSDGLDRLIAALMTKEPRIVAAQGTGCFRALRLSDPECPGPLAQHRVPLLVQSIRRAGAVVHPGPGGIQLIPALTYGPVDLEELGKAIGEGISEHFARATPPVSLSGVS